MSLCIFIRVEQTLNLCKAALIHDLNKTPTLPVDVVPRNYLQTKEFKLKIL